MEHECASDDAHQGKRWGVQKAAPNRRASEERVGSEARQGGDNTQKLCGGHKGLGTLHGFNSCVTCVTSTVARLTTQCCYRTDTWPLPAAHSSSFCSRRLRCWPQRR